MSKRSGVPSQKLKGEPIKGVPAVIRRHKACNRDLLAPQEAQNAVIGGVQLMYGAIRIRTPSPDLAHSGAAYAPSICLASSTTARASMASRTASFACSTDAMA